MVYYAMPLIMKSENSTSSHQQQQQLCSQVVPENYTQPAPQQPQRINLNTTNSDSSSSSSQTSYTYQLLTSSTDFLQDQNQIGQQQQQPQLQQQQISTRIQPKQTKSFKCDQCNMNFGSKSAHTSHTKSHAKQQIIDISTASSNTSHNTPKLQSSDPYQCGKSI